MGSTFKVMGLPVQAFEFWWKALRIQPTFWDVLVGLVLVRYRCAH